MSRPLVCSRSCINSSQHLCAPSRARQSKGKGLRCRSWTEGPAAWLQRRRREPRKVLFSGPNGGCKSRWAQWLCVFGEDDTEHNGGIRPLYPGRWVPFLMHIFLPVLETLIRAQVEMLIREESLGEGPPSHTRQLPATAPATAQQSSSIRHGERHVSPKVNPSVSNNTIVKATSWNETCTRPPGQWSQNLPPPATPTRGTPSPCGKRPPPGLPDDAEVTGRAGAG